MTHDVIDWSGSYATTREALQTVAVHIVARRRNSLTGRFGLRPAPGGFATPMFGNEEVVRVDGTILVRERRIDDRAVTTTIDLPGQNLDALAGFAEVDLAGTFSVGRDTPELRDPRAALVLSAEHVAVMAEWFSVGAQGIDRTLARLGSDGDPAVAQIWPEHFDLGVDVAVGPIRANLGASPGDGFSAAPYVYVGPWTDARPGDPAYWNAPFGAAKTYDEIADSAAVEDFFAHGLAQLARA